MGSHFRKLWGKEAGWAHSVLFTADLRSFADRLVATKKVEVEAKEDKVKQEVEVKTEVTTAVALGVPEDAKVEVEDKVEGRKTNGMKRKNPDAIIHTSQSTETRRTSKRLRSRRGTL